MTRVPISLPGQTVIFDYGEVISLAQSAADWEVITGLAGVGCDSEPFWRAYFAHRDGLDQGRAGVTAYWQAIAGDLGASWDDTRVHELSSIRASMSFARECECSAARYRRKGTRSRMDGGRTCRSDSDPSGAGRGSAICDVTGES